MIEVLHFQPKQPPASFSEISSTASKNINLVYEGHLERQKLFFFNSMLVSVQNDCTTGTQHTNPKFPLQASAEQLASIIVNNAISTELAMVRLRSATPRRCAPDTRQVYLQEPSPQV